MDKINFKVKGIEYVMAIDKYKIFFGDNYIFKFNSRQAIKQFLENIQLSEYQESFELQGKIELNENKINHKNWEYYEITPYYSVNNDFKLSAKSLSLKFIESAFDETLCLDEINTINNLFKIVSEQLSEEIKMEQEITFSITSSDFTIKSLIKYIGLSLQNDDLSIGESDLSYDEIMLLQLNMIDKIANSTLNKLKKFLVILDAPLLTEKIIRKLKNIEGDNLKVIVFTNDHHIPMPIDNYVISRKGFIDLFFEESILNNITNVIGKNISISQTKEEIAKYIANDSTVDQEVMSII